MILTKSRIYESKIIESLNFSFFTNFTDYLEKEEFEYRCPSDFLIRTCVEYMQSNRDFSDIQKEIILYLRNQDISFSTLKESFVLGYIPFYPEIFDVFYGVENIKEYMIWHYLQTENYSMYQYCEINSSC